MIPKASYPLLKHKHTLDVYPNSPPFSEYPDMVGCFTPDGKTDFNSLTAVEIQNVFPDGVPTVIKEGAKKIAEAAEEAAANPEVTGLSLEASVVTTNLERMYASGEITRDYLMKLTGTVPLEDFQDLRQKMEAVMSELTKLKTDDERVAAEAEEKEAEAKKAKEEADKKAAEAAEAKAKTKKAAPKKAAAKKETKVDTSDFEV